MQALLIAGAFALVLVILIAWMEARARVAETEDRAERRQIVLSRRFSRGGGK